MAKILARLGLVLVAVCCTGAAPALAQPQRGVAAKAADGLRNACPSQTPITPVARLDAMASHIKAMREAIETVRPALAQFYDSLSDEQKAHFNIMASNQ